MKFWRERERENKGEQILAPLCGQVRVLVIQVDLLAYVESITTKENFSSHELESYTKSYGLCCPVKVEPAKTSAASKPQSIVDSYTASLEDMTAQGALDVSVTGNLWDLWP
ncbi:hypothetical protein IGI04_033668 [Brassica rapa subsp. trilocularis]|uniref:Uncharacterized protein n=1 Tax=Brassica rapa subsp. trilocularis TaxID=1813537 RepID=A0ABQ7L9U7_BRACM|nr:hypothetical protein IGI04_033668 [Brassica rapa subsp. trilocularis]